MGSGVEEVVRKEGGGGRERNEKRKEAIIRIEVLACTSTQLHDFAATSLQYPNPRLQTRQRTSRTNEYTNLHTHTHLNSSPPLSYTHPISLSSFSLTYPTTFNPPFIPFNHPSPLILHPQSSSTPSPPPNTLFLYTNLSLRTNLKAVKISQTPAL